MKITYPREKRKIRLAHQGNSILYVLLGSGTENSSGKREWWLMDFWDLPYTFKRYDDARLGKKKVENRLREYEWEDDKCVIAKIQL